MTKTLTAVILTALLAACAGRAAQPVMAYQYGDETKSCEGLRQEMGMTEGEIARLMPKTEKTGKNIALGVAGALFIVPLLFIDLSQSEQTEIEAHRQRYNRLFLMSTEKKCSGVATAATPG